MGEQAGTPVTEADIEAMTTWTLVRLGRHLEHLLAEALRPHGLTPQQYGILAQLSARPALTQAALAEAVLMRPQSMQHQLERLEDLGLIERPALRGRGQRNPVHLSEAGLTALSRVHGRIQHANSDTALGVDPSEHEALDAMAHRLLLLESLG
jgi:DNA-binding MarR family transcriptional regulator